MYLTLVDPPVLGEVVPGVDLRLSHHRGHLEHALAEGVVGGHEVVVVYLDLDDVGLGVGERALSKKKDKKLKNYVKSFVFYFYFIFLQ